MNEKQIQEVMALVDEFGDSRRRQGNDEYSPESVNRRYAAQYGKDADELRSAVESALREQVREVPEGFVAVERDLLKDAIESVDDYRTGLEFGMHDRKLLGRLKSALSAAPTQPPAREVQKKPAPEWFAKALFVSRLIDRVTRDVAELPDRNSPEDWPEAMLVTAAELADIIRAALPVEPSDGTAPTQPAQAEQQDPEINLHMITDPVRRAAHEAYANHPDRQGHYVRMLSLIHI